MRSHVLALAALSAAFLCAPVMPATSVRSAGPFASGSAFGPAAAYAAEASWGRVFTVPAQTSVRENPDGTALQVRVLKAGQRVRADFFEDGWAAVFDLKETTRSELRALGYVRVTDLTGGREVVVDESRADAAEARKPARGAKREAEPEQPKPAKSAKRAKPEAKIELAAEEVSVAKPDASAKHGKTAKAEPRESVKSGKDTKSAKKTKAAKEFGEVLVSDRTLSVRAERDKDSTLRKVLRAGQKVRVDFVENGWAAVFDPEEKTRDESRAWGYCYAKFLVPEADYESGQAGSRPRNRAGRRANAAASAPEAQSQATGKGAGKDAGAGKAAQAKNGKEAEEDVGYTVLERKADRKAKPPVTVLRAKLNLSRPPAKEAMRKIAREIWKAERKKNETLQLELLLSRMDPRGLAYAVVKFHDDGRISEFWWRDVVLEDGKQGQ